MYNNNPIILFQGDSITDCGRDRGNAASLGEGYVNMVAGELLFGNPEKHYTIINKGISGNRVVDLFARWKEDCLNLKPDVLSILIGINDVWHEFSRGAGVDAKKYERVYEMLLEETVSALPETKIILLEPFVLPVADKSGWKTETKMRQDVCERIAVKYNAVYIPLQERFNKAAKHAPFEYWLYDGVHPTAAGHRLIANEWLKSCSL